MSGDAYNLKDGSTYTLDPLHRIVALPSSQMVENIRSIMPTNLPSLSMTYPYRGKSPVGSGRRLKQEKTCSQKLRGRTVPTCVGPCPRVRRSIAAGMSASVIKRILIWDDVMVTEEIGRFM